MLHDFFFNSNSIGSASDQSDTSSSCFNLVLGMISWFNKK